MNNHPHHDPGVSREARYVFAYLASHGGSMRLRPMLRHLRMEPSAFVGAVIELTERYWIIVHWRKPLPGAAEEQDRPYTEIERLCTTRFGRGKYRTTWPAY